MSINDYNPPVVRVISGIIAQKAAAGEPGVRLPGSFAGDRHARIVKKGK